jgi:hypothetical protein
VRSEVGFGDWNLRNGALFRRRDGFNLCVVEAGAALEECLERRFDARLEGAGREVENPQVLDVGSLTASVDEGVVGAPENERREQLFAVAVASEG